MNYLAALFLVVSVLGATPPVEKPNFILINIDDLGYADIGPFGGTHRTPHLDRMAKEGRMLTSHYAAPVCSPSRAALLTGCYPKRVLPIPHVLFPGAAVGLDPDERTIADALKEVGYATACIGKWHVGDQPEFLPNRQGFDTFYGIPYSNDMGPSEDGTKSNPGAPIPSSEVVAEKALRAKNQGGDEVGIKIHQPPLPLLENETVIKRIRQAEQKELTRQLTDRAVAFIEAQRSRPFFLYLPYAAVHFPLYPSEPLAGRSPIGAWIEEVDANVGRVLNRLRELQLDRKTLVIFTSDNGGSLSNGSSNRPFRGAKGQVYEGGIRVGTIAWWPGKVPAGSTTRSITTVMDFLPTFANLAGARPVVDRRIDGVDLWPLLAGDADDSSSREHFFYFRGLELQAVRSGSWKLHLASGELYNLATDLSETKNVAAEERDVVEQLRVLAQTMEGDLGLVGIGPGCRPIGSVKNAAPIISADGSVRKEFSGRYKILP